eukprot:TRINITY_DN10634_c0_g1_i1.p1 TRINITY_DN10634_c0_g1~~TRINITY_DN10634_c0_g1_i1.p1  ORF type:complete len:318 (+),score=48.46 TRINITY_DN10634_c0_g1_i1:80-1033(+)
MPKRKCGGAGDNGKRPRPASTAAAVAPTQGAAHQAPRPPAAQTVGANGIAAGTHSRGEKRPLPGALRWPTLSIGAWLAPADRILAHLLCSSAAPARLREEARAACAGRPAAGEDCYCRALAGWARGRVISVQTAAPGGAGPAEQGELDRVYTVQVDGCTGDFTAEAVRSISYRRRAEGVVQWGPPARRTLPQGTHRGRGWGARPRAAQGDERLMQADRALQHHIARALRQWPLADRRAVSFASEVEYCNEAIAERTTGRVHVHGEGGVQEKAELKEKQKEYMTAEVTQKVLHKESLRQGDSAQAAAPVGEEPGTVLL